MIHTPDFIDALTLAGCRPKLYATNKWRAKCPAHDDSNPSLGVADADGTALACCYAGCSWKAIVQALGLDMRGPSQAQPRTTPKKETPPKPATDLVATMARYVAELNRVVDLGQPRLTQQAELLGLSEASLQTIGVGWSGRWKAFAFPMRDDREQVIGIRLRASDGRKWAEPGSRNGLFYEPGCEAGGPLYVVEGPTDTAALIDMGLDRVVGRPGCNCGNDELARYVAARRAPVVMLADNDGPGLAGARSAARLLALFAPSVRVIQPPSGIKDARQWLQRGGTKRDVMKAVAV